MAKKDKNVKLAVGAALGLAVLGTGAYLLSRKSTSGSGSSGSATNITIPGNKQSALVITTALDQGTSFPTTLIQQLTALGLLVEVTVPPPAATTTGWNLTVSTQNNQDLSLNPVQPSFTINSVT